MQATVGADGRLTAERLDVRIKTGGWVSRGFEGAGGWKALGNQCLLVLHSKDCICFQVGGWVGGLDGGMGRRRCWFRPGPASRQSAPTTHLIPLLPLPARCLQAWAPGGRACTWSAGAAPACSRRALWTPHYASPVGSAHARLAYLSACLALPCQQ